MSYLPNDPGDLEAENAALRQRIGALEAELAAFRERAQLSVPAAAGLPQRGAAGQSSIAPRTNGIELSVDATTSRAELAGQTSYTAALRNIGEPAQDTQALQASEQRFRLLANNAPVLIWLSDRDGLCTWFNDQWLAFVGRAIEQELGNGWTENVHPADYDRCMATYQHALNGLTRFSMEYRLRHHQGEYRWLLDTGQPIFSATNVFEGFIGSCIDITEHKQAEQAMQRATARLHTLAEASRAFAEAGEHKQRLLDQIAQISAEKLQAACIIRLLSYDGQWLEVAALSHFDVAGQPDMQATLSPWRIHLGDRAPAAVATRTGLPQFVPQLDREALRALLPPERQGILELFLPHSLIVVPLQLHDRTIGSLALARSASRPQAFDADDLSLAQDLGERAALAIANVQLLSQVQTELAERQRVQKITDLLYVGGQLLARPLGQDAILETLLDVLKQLIPYDGANILLPDSSNTFHVRYLRGYETWTDPEAVKALILDPKQRPSIGQIVATQRSLLVSDTRQEPTWQPLLGTNYVGCWLGVPLIANNKLVGIYSIDQHQPNSLTANDVRLAETLAVSAATAIERAQLIAQLHDEQAQLARRVEERTAELRLALERMQALYAITSDTSASENLFEALQRTAERVRAALKADRIVLLIFDWNAQSIEHLIYSSREEEPGAQPTDPEQHAPGLSDISFEEFMSGLTGWAVRERRPAISPKDSVDPRESPLSLRRRIETNSGAIVVAPLIYLDEVFGTLTGIRRPDEPNFSADDIDLLTAAASQISKIYGGTRLTLRLQLANAELSRATRLKDEFLANMSHELRTPLNSILGRSQSLQEYIYGSLTPKQSEVLRGIEESGEHLLALINDILDLSKIEADRLELRFEPIDVHLICRMSIRMVLQSALQKRINLSSTIDNLIETITADERRLKQILVNLLSNAIKFTPQGGKVGLDVEADREQQTVTFTVWDTGIGIAEPDIARLFQPFVQIDSRLNRQYEGTGLGLALVRRLAEAHAGSVALQSVPGQGSRFSVTLPWSPAHPTPFPNTAAANLPLPAAQPALAAKNAPPPAEQSAGFLPETGARAEQKRVLLVEDNASNIELTEHYLRAKGYDVVVARNGGEAILRAQQATPHAILMDIQMPGMNGLEAIRSIRTDLGMRTVPIIALTALAMPGDRERCIEAGADEYLTKPVSLSKLVATIESLLQRR